MLENLERVVIALAVFLAAASAVKDWSDHVPSVAQDYYEKTRTGGEIEAAYTAPGGYEISYAEYPSSDLMLERYEIWYPDALAADDGRTWPVVVMANGTGVPASRYIPIFRHLASWGFVVIGNEQQNAWSGAASSESVALLLRLNEDPDSVFYHKIDAENIGSAGHSQGAIGAINAVTVRADGVQYKALYTASTPSSRYAATLGWSYDPALIGTPWLMTAGTGLLDAGEAETPEVTEQAQELSISPLWSQQENYALAPADTLKLRARRTGADHADMLPWGDGYMTAWFMYWLQGDEAAGRAFFGPDAEILTNPVWQDVEKNF